MDKQKKRRQMPLTPHIAIIQTKSTYSLQDLQTYKIKQLFTVVPGSFIIKYI